MNTTKHSAITRWLLVFAAGLLVASCSSSKKPACTGDMCGTAANSGSSATSGGSGGTSGSGSGGTSTGKGSGGSTSSTGGSSASTGGKTGGSGGTGGSGQPEEDAGSTSGNGGTGGGTVTPLPTDGNQLSVCTMAQGECNRGFACHMPAAGGGQGFCSKVCTMDSDCSGLAPSGATYTCPATGGFGAATRVCEIACMGTMDTMTCPKDMACFASGFTGGGMGGGMATYACSYTAGAGMPPGTKTAWESCMTSQECVMGLGCFGGTPAFGMQAARPGHCAQSCMMTADCTDKPSSGSINPTCVPSGAPTPAMACGLSCGMMPMGCPTGMTCVAGFGGGHGMTAPSYCQWM